MLIDPTEPTVIPLEAIELRILGSLMEKEQATPEYYPLTLNALAAACNQKSSREPVTDFSEDDIERALDRLQSDRLVYRIIGGRSTRWQHNLDKAWHLDRGSKAVMTLLLLRGAQTPGEIRNRSDRLHKFGSVEEVEGTLGRLSEGEAALVVELHRQSGQKETRWFHRFSAAALQAAPDVEPAPLSPRAESLSTRIERLEGEVLELRDALEYLKRQLGG
jgi:uncharacterized protein YceH (UPF0502 family)